jgi:hypothetical protein
MPVIAEGEVLLRTVFLSLDPYMRGRMSDGPSYAPPVALDQVMVGATVCRVAKSQYPEFAAGVHYLRRLRPTLWRIRRRHGTLGTGVVKESHANGGIGERSGSSGLIEACRANCTDFFAWLQSARFIPSSGGTEFPVNPDKRLSFARNAAERRIGPR